MAKNQPRQFKSSKKILEGSVTTIIMGVIFVCTILLTLFLYNSVLSKPNPDKLNSYYKKNSKPVARQVVVEEPVQPVDSAASTSINEPIEESNTVSETAPEPDVQPVQEAVPIVTPVPKQQPVFASKPIVHTQVLPKQPVIEKQKQPSQQMTTRAITPVAKTEPIKQPKPKSQKAGNSAFDNAVNLMAAQRYEEAVSAFDAYRKGDQTDQEHIKIAAYNIAQCMLQLYIAEKVSSKTCKNAWYGVQGVYAKGTRQYREADSVLARFGVK